MRSNRDVSSDLDLRFLSADEESTIRQVLQRDDKLRKQETGRVRQLRLSIADPQHLKVMTGQWFDDLRSQRYGRQADATDIVRSSIRRKKTPGSNPFSKDGETRDTEDEAEGRDQPTETPGCHPTFTRSQLPAPLEQEGDAVEEIALDNDIPSVDVLGWTYPHYRADKQITSYGNSLNACVPPSQESSFMSHTTDIDSHSSNPKSSNGSEAGFSQAEDTVNESGTVTWSEMKVNNAKIERKEPKVSSRETAHLHEAGQTAGRPEETCRVGFEDSDHSLGRDRPGVASLGPNQHVSPGVSESWSWWPDQGTSSESLNMKPAEGHSLMTRPSCEETHNVKGIGLLLASGASEPVKWLQPALDIKPENCGSRAESVRLEEDSPSTVGEPEVQPVEDNASMTDTPNTFFSACALDAVMDVPGTENFPEKDSPPDGIVEMAESKVRELHSGEFSQKPEPAYSHTCEDRPEQEVIQESAKPSIPKIVVISTVSSMPEDADRLERQAAGPKVLLPGDLAVIPFGSSLFADSWEDKDLDSEDDCSSVSSMGSDLGRRGYSGSTLSISERSSSMLSVYSDAGDFGNLAVQGAVEFSLRHSSSGELVITVEQCQDLALANARKQRTDPYVKTYLYPDKSRLSKRKTSIKKRTVNPVYGELLKYKVKKEDLRGRTLNLSVWHNDSRGRNVFLGQVEVDFKTWDWGFEALTWYNLLPKNVDILEPPECHGRLTVALKYVPPGSIGGGRPGTSEIHIWLREARDLRLLKPRGVDSFVKCYMLPDVSRKSRQKTRVVKKSQHPVYNHAMVYDGFRPGEVREACCELSIWDQNTLSNQFLGGVRLSLGTGKSYGKKVDWMDSANQEVELWEKMLSNPNIWVEEEVPLRSSMTPRK
ncbi:hypothetical protein AAFF_G00221530 [Aldrovandia affinis]|uniref:Synaptotagmin-like protein 1 n=1 Tax=Aldrovandia affinis TaxID=143900 RepID=A0AAD7RFI8_9TELE|nr:hypothetical protein AAFF_G00221530 [Aldrovandia affinis]